ncbi:MAG: hypothetical protein VB133_09560 [Anaeromusa sp.]|nr:hypothetical protein [Anaeromusa sp.]MEA4835370.1 hypothetical protein [Anaeromusa sp.]
MKHSIAPGELVKPLRPREESKDSRERKKDETHLKEIFADMLGGEPG